MEQEPTPSWFAFDRGGPQFCLLFGSGLDVIQVWEVVDAFGIC